MVFQPSVRLDGLPARHRNGRWHACSGRYILKRRGQAIKVVSFGPIAAIVIGGLGFGGIFAWGQGENLYVLYLDGYRMLFGSGT